MSEVGDRRAIENWRHVLSIIGVGRKVSGEDAQLAMNQVMSGASGDV